MIWLCGAPPPAHGTKTQHGRVPIASATVAGASWYRALVPETTHRAPPLLSSTGDGCVAVACRPLSTRPPKRAVITTNRWRRPVWCAHSARAPAAGGGLTPTVAALYEGRAVWSVAPEKKGTHHQVTSAACVPPRGPTCHGQQAPPSSGRRCTTNAPLPSLHLALRAARAARALSAHTVISATVTLGCQAWSSTHVRTGCRRGCARQVVVGARTAHRAAAPAWSTTTLGRFPAHDTRFAGGQ